MTLLGLTPRTRAQFIKIDAFAVCFSFLINKVFRANVPQSIARTLVN